MIKNNHTVPSGVPAAVFAVATQSNSVPQYLLIDRDVDGDSGVSGNNNIPFPSQKSVMEFFTRTPPESRKWNFPGNSHSRKLGMYFFAPIPVPTFGNGIFHSRSCSQSSKIILPHPCGDYDDNGNDHQQTWFPQFILYLRRHCDFLVMVMLILVGGDSLCF